LKYLRDKARAVLEWNAHPAANPQEAMPREVLYEFHRIGAFAKVTAIDAQSGIEVAIVGPAGSSEALLRANALRKLEAVMRRTGKDIG
jgi:hypothetical protein